MNNLLRLRTWPSFRAKAFGFTVSFKRLITGAYEPIQGPCDVFCLMSNREMEAEEPTHGLNFGVFPRSIWQLLSPELPHRLFKICLP